MGPPGNFFNGWAVDKVGRIPMMLIGLTGCVVALIGECLSVSVFQKNGSEAAGKAAVFFIFFFLPFSSAHIDATTYIYAAESFPNPV
ncbi:uncharacterized protein A1O5_10771 [Cladophialophora psammophila CBS 110553]|uniref:Major facilitator superfamily (MFS) profile domain-containing protein n=1 Tax=Cladophialophora psammophila CBS 110553 TaxID=1182543 RepID=W9WMC2_9EURO|nr:uncharacterized protein A1O5_10771 [Cladophialophora psammophila CBS 110553]EXJ66155.1 hypothetical protein A1O5_10771 [Cladophialophora psammophila CBS 110553]